MSRELRENAATARESEDAGFRQFLANKYTPKGWKIGSGGLKKSKNPLIFGL